MKPLMVRLREAKNNSRLNDPDAKSKSHTADSLSEGDAGPAPERTSNIWLKSSQASDSILRWLRHFAATASTRQTSTGAADTKGSATDRIMSGAFGRAVESSRQTLSQIRGLPKDDDWMTWLGKALNQMTGYNRIFDLKTKVEESGSKFKAARHDLDKIKELHARTVQERIANQREINSLLQRKHLWNEDDVARFTGLYKDEHQAEMTELSASESLKEAEALVDRRYDQLVETIRERYHEEQIWSDKIRRASTYGTWAVLFMNILALFMAQAIFEPRKRRKIVAGVDEKLTAAIGDQQARIDDFAQGMLQRQAEHERSIAGVAGHLANVTAALGMIATRQEAEMSATADRLLGSPLPMLSSSSTLPRGAADNGLIASVLAGDDGGYSDSELDMYYSHAAAAQRQRSADSSWKWKSMLWKAARPSKHSGASNAPSNESEQNKERGFTRAEAGQLALETAAVTGILTAAVASLYFSS
ncbi:sensitivity to high expression protein she9 [Kickxella alabastrina]|nr:sensitivity to high expression protein she9 [Kickxella alabastrina]